VLLRQQGQGHNPPGTHLQRFGHPAALVDAHVTVPSQAHGVHVQGFHHRTPATDASALWIEAGQAIAQYGYIRGGAADVDDPGIASARQMPGTDNTGGRS